MKMSMSSFVMGLMMAALLVTASFAQGKSRSGNFTLSDSLLVGETVVEKGQYRVKYDAETSELQILRDGEIVKTIKARVQEGDRKATYHAMETRQGEKGRMLVSVMFEGDRRTFLVDQTSGSSVVGEGQ